MLGDHGCDGGVGVAVGGEWGWSGFVDEFGYGGGAEFGDDDEVGSADAGDHVAVVVADAAVGAGVGWDVSGEPAVELHGGGRAGDLHHPGGGGGGHSPGTLRDGHAAGLRGG